MDREANRYFRELTREREETDEERRRIEKKLEKLEEIEKDEKNTSAFYKKAKVGRQEGDIEKLAEKIAEMEEGKAIEIETEHTDEKEKRRIARNFYEQLWKKRETNRDAQEDLIEKIEAKLSEEEKERCEG